MFHLRSCRSRKKLQIKDDLLLADLKSSPNIVFIYLMSTFSTFFYNLSNDCPISTKAIYILSAYKTTDWPLCSLKRIIYGFNRKCVDDSKIWDLYSNLFLELHLYIYIKLLSIILLIIYDLKASRAPVISRDGFFVWYLYYCYVWRGCLRVKGEWVRFRFSWCRSGTFDDVTLFDIFYPNNLPYRKKLPN